MNYFSTSTYQHYSSTRNSRSALEGFYCHSHNYAFFTSGSYPKYWLINLLEPRRIKSIVYVVPVANNIHTYFKNVKFRLGDNSNYVHNSLIASFSGEASDRYPHELVLNPPVMGQYLSIESSDSNYVALAAIQINEEWYK